MIAATSEWIGLIETTTCGAESASVGVRRRAAVEAARPSRENVMGVCSILRL